MDSRTRDRRNRSTFWIDDRVVDEFSPVMRRYPYGAAALAVYVVLARRADREGESWPRLELIAAKAGASTRTVQRAIRLLEVLGLIEVTVCHEQGSNRQTSNLYTLLTPPDPLPQIDPDPEKWPPPSRRTLLVHGAHRARSMPEFRAEQETFAGLGVHGVRSVRMVPQTEAYPAETREMAGAKQRVMAGTPCQPDTLPPVTVTPPRCQADTPSPVRLSPQEGNTREGNTLKKGFFDGKDEHERERVAGSQGPEGTGFNPSVSPARSRSVSPMVASPLPSFVIEEVGLSNRQVWAATLGELARRDDVAVSDVESWLRPAALIGRNGETLIIGAPNAMCRDRIATRLLPAVCDAMSAMIGSAVRVEVVIGVAGSQGGGVEG